MESDMAGRRVQMQELNSKHATKMFTLNRVKESVCVLADLKKYYTLAYNISTKRTSR